MTQTLLHAVARKAEAITPDADLLARYARERDHPAFEELVRRHGPLVWAVCRNLLPHHADAEDAFQAVFLALVRSAASIRDGRTVPAWLHGVAVRIATRARREFARRRARERTAAMPEAERPVPDVAWESLVATVHEEIQRLPEAERTAFVLCDLQGVSQADAAARLGWPLGSVSGRLCKARQRLLDRLAARGVAPAAVVGIGLTAGAASAVPAKLFDVVKVFPSSPGAASTVVVALARGLTEGVTMRMKLTAAAAVMVAAIGLTGGAMVLSKADAQPPGGAPPMGGGGIGGFGGGGAPPGGPPPMGGGGGLPGMMGMGMAGFAPANWDYKFVDVKSDRKEFEKVITQHGKEGWEFCSSERFGQGELVLVFKKSKGVVGFGGGGFGGAGGGGGMGMGGPGVPLGPGGGFGGGGQNQFEVFQLKHASAADVVTALQKAFPKVNLKAVAEKMSNSVVIVSADPASMKDIAKFITELDAKDRPKPGPAGGAGGAPGGPMGGVPKPAESAINIFNLKFAKAEEMVTVMKKLYPNADMTADPRTNTVIVRADVDTLGELRALMARLDVEVPKSK
jgi:RNA polymerase sigma factor (sigma-70 family)